MQGSFLREQFQRIVSLATLASGLLLATTGFADVANTLEAPDTPANFIQLPAGFKLSVFARLPSVAEAGLSGFRFMAFGPDGNLYVSVSSQGKVMMLPDLNHDGVADAMVTVSEALTAPQGLVFVDDGLLVANADGIVKLKQQSGHWPAAKIIPWINDLPSGGHALKSLKLGPDGYLYTNVGSSCNVCVEDDPKRATILRYTLQGKPAGAIVTVGRHKPSPVWATGLRNSQGFAWHPMTQAMFATNEGADMRALTAVGPINDDIPPEHLNRIESGKDYGWPYCWGVSSGSLMTDPNVSAPDGFCKASQGPELLFPAHSTPIGITFLNLANVPDAYKKDALVALHGSWNRKVPSGYKIVRVKLEGDKPVAIEDFATGWLNQRAAWGRPVDLIVGPDGAIYVSDDRSSMIYRITYDTTQH